MAKTGYYNFSGGLNYRDDYIAPTELRDANNLYWDGGKLALRNGYEQRNADLSPPTTDYILIKVVGQERIKNDIQDEQFLFVHVAQESVTGIERLVPYHKNNLPTATSDSFAVVDTTLYHVPWTTTLQLQTAVLDDKVYVAIESEDPYVIYTTGTTWYFRELYLGKWNNGATTGANIIQNTSVATSDNLGWTGTKWVVAGEAEGQGYVMVGDEKTAYFGLKEADVDPSKDIDVGTTASIDGIRESWDVAQNIKLNPDARIWKGLSIGKHMFLMGYDGVYRLNLRNFYDQDFDFSRISDRGCYGGALAHDVGLFYVGKDGIYANDSIMSYNISKKMWGEVEDNHTTLASLKDSSIEAHKGRVYISFPDATAADVWSFDPDWIYTEGDESYAPMHRFQYTDTGGNVRGFEALRSYEGRLYGVSSQHIWELDHDTLDQHSTGSGRPIQWHMRSGWDDQRSPNTEKMYTKLGIETSSAIADGTTDGNYDFQVGFSVNHSTGGNARGLSTGIDMDISTGSQHVHKSLEIPLSSDGYVLDGNCGAVEIIGETSNVTTGAGDMGLGIYGFSLEYQPVGVPHEEVTT